MSEIKATNQNPFQIKFAPSGDIHKTYVPNSLPRNNGDSLKKKNGPAPPPSSKDDPEDPAEKFRRDVERITTHRYTYDWN